MSTSVASVRTAVWNPKMVSSRPPRKKPTPFSAFFDPVRIATQRYSEDWSFSGTTSLTALLELILLRSFATPDRAWEAMTYGTTSSDGGAKPSMHSACLLYTSDAADEED